MTKLFKIVSALIVLMMIFTGAYAAEIALENYELSDTYISADITLDAIPDDLTDLSAITIKYNYDDTVLEYVSTTSGICNGITATPGRIVWFDSASKTESTQKITGEMLSGADNVLFTVTFTSESALLTTPEIVISYVQLVDEDLVPSQNVTIFNDAVAVERVITLIEEIGDVSYSEEVWSRIERAEKAYLALRDDLKASVTNLSVLEAAKAQYEACKPVVNKTTEPVEGYGNLSVVVFSNIPEGKKVALGSFEAQMVKISEDGEEKIYYIIATELAIDEEEVVIEDGTSQAFEMGDVDGIAGVTALDALCVNQKSANLDVAFFNAPMSFVKADVNGSGTITAFDALLISRLAVGIDVVTNFVTGK